MLALITHFSPLFKVVIIVDLNFFLKLTFSPQKFDSATK